MPGTTARMSGVRFPLLSTIFLKVVFADLEHIAFLSYLRLSVYMAVVAVAIVLSFHLKTRATDIELRMAKPLGAIFWALSVACLLVGCANYIRELSWVGRWDMRERHRERERS